jgi:hypothetical protein
MLLQFVKEALKSFLSESLLVCSVSLFRSANIFSKINGVHELVRKTLRSISVLVLCCVRNVHISLLLTFWLGKAREMDKRVFGERNDERKHGHVK